MNVGSSVPVSLDYRHIRSVLQGNINTYNLSAVYLALLGGPSCWWKDKIKSCNEHEGVDQIPMVQASPVVESCECCDEPWLHESWKFLFPPN
jgi:hypothetical protein